MERKAGMARTSQTFSFQGLFHVPSLPFVLSAASIWPMLPPSVRPAIVQFKDNLQRTFFAVISSCHHTNCPPLAGHLSPIGGATLLTRCRTAILSSFGGKALIGIPLCHFDAFQSRPTFASRRSKGPSHLATGLAMLFCALFPLTFVPWPAAPTPRQPVFGFVHRLGRLLAASLLAKRRVICHCPPSSSHGHRPETNAETQFP